MARYINAELAKAEFAGNFRDEYSTAHIKALIDNIPTADVVSKAKFDEAIELIDNLLWDNGDGFSVENYEKLKESD